ncbi:MAG TPA: tRNA uridine-5-carboxymethylaminomethyl(34) synthesis GTPase MnmE [Candidatus Baltobacteraceae bacterium]|nr:tRNA uridine-5-carboxymethylaminomethyl(34) synthesis GTPase MnmE [Candidatus Baltobacteraceae bacterium]
MPTSKDDNTDAAADTIAAIATPLGEGGIAMVRLSGPQSLAIADASFRAASKSGGPPSAAPTHTIHFGKIVRAGRVVDEVLLSVMRAPRTFTREDVVEITCHGGLLPAKLVLDTVLENGARLAAPGEFTRRAFLNGRIDLAQAEAVADLIHSRTELAAAAAREQLAGKLSQRINRLRDDLMKTLAHVEAHIDFPDEDIAPETRRQLLERLRGAARFMDQLLRTADEGRLLRRGIRAAIIGRPNVGKSSLLNQLLGRDRAIVSPIPGTTRDTIEETANVRGIPIVFIDTAGLRDSADEIEMEGVRRSRGTLAAAELILHVLDGAEPLSDADGTFFAEFSGKKQIIVRNKSDLPRRLELPAGLAAMEVCCLSGEGIEELKDAIKGKVWAGEIDAEMLEAMINSRHEDALRRGRAATERAVSALEGDLGLELAALDLRAAANSVGEIVGKTTTEDLLDAIFSQFCLGK